LYLFHCRDFVEEGDPPSGTGIVVRPMRDPLNPSGPPRTVLRAHAPWQLFLANRTMSLYGGRTFAEWTTIEGPAPVKRAGRYFCGYSGGNYTGAYGTGEAVAGAPLGPYVDHRGARGPIFGTIPGLIEGPGHFSVVRPDLVHDWIVLHGRRPGESVRRVWLCPASWDVDGIRVGPLTDQPQPAPPLPTDVSRFSDPDSPARSRWTLEGGPWIFSDEGLVQIGDRPGHSFAWREGLRLGRNWTVEVYVRLLDEVLGLAGIWFMTRREIFSVMLYPESCIVAWGDAQEEGDLVPLPTLGDQPYDPTAFHRIEVTARAGRVETRVDGVVLFADSPLPPGPSRLGLTADGAVAFDAVSITPGADA
jgi:hypothetical protein